MQSTAFTVFFEIGYLVSILYHLKETNGRTAMPHLHAMMEANPRQRVSEEQRQAIEHLANFVRSNGSALEQVVRDRSRDDPKFRYFEAETVSDTVRETKWIQSVCG